MTVKMSNKKGHFLVMNKDEHDSSSEEEENATKHTNTEHKYDLEAVEGQEQESLDDEEEEQAVMMMQMISQRVRIKICTSLLHFSMKKFFFYPRKAGHTRKPDTI